MSTSSGAGFLKRLPEPYAHAYLVLAFFVLPAVGVVLSGGGVQRPPSAVPTAVLWAVVVHHGLFVIAAILFE